MTDTKHDPCCVMADKMFDQLDSVPVGDETPELLAKIIRDYTILPEMVSMLEVVEHKSSDAVLVAHVKELLAKAGRK